MRKSKRSRQRRRKIVDEIMESSVVDPSEIDLDKKQQNQVSFEASPSKHSESFKSDQSVSELFNLFVNKPLVKKRDWRGDTIIEPIKEIESKYEYTPNNFNISSKNPGQSSVPQFTFRKC